jgi:mitogen-activated protein kinase 1/3
MYRKGALVPTSLDLYLALEFCDQGDLYHMRGQVRACNLLFLFA